MNAKTPSVSKVDEAPRRWRKGAMVLFNRTWHVSIPIILLGVFVFAGIDFLYTPAVLVFGCMVLMGCLWLQVPLFELMYQASENQHINFMSWLNGFKGGWLRFKENPWPLCVSMGITMIMLILLLGLMSLISQNFLAAFGSEGGYTQPSRPSSLELAFKGLSFLVMFSYFFSRPVYTNIKDVLMVRRGLSFKEAGLMLSKIEKENSNSFVSFKITMAMCGMVCLFFPTLSVILWPWMTGYQVMMYRELLEEKINI